MRAPQCSPPAGRLRPTAVEAENRPSMSDPKDRDPRGKRRRRRRRRRQQALGPRGCRRARQLGVGVAAGDRRLQPRHQHAEAAEARPRRPVDRRDGEPSAPGLGSVPTRASEAPKPKLPGGGFNPYDSPPAASEAGGNPYDNARSTAARSMQPTPPACTAGAQADGPEAAGRVDADQEAAGAAEERRRRRGLASARVDVTAGCSAGPIRRETFRLA